MLNILIILCNVEHFLLQRKLEVLSPLQDQSSKAPTMHQKVPALFSYSGRSDNGVEPTREKTAFIAEESKQEWKQIGFVETTWN